MKDKRNTFFQHINFGKFRVISFIRKSNLSHRLLISFVVLPLFTCLIIVFLLGFTFFSTIKKNERDHITLIANMIVYNLNQYLNSIITPLNVLSTKVSLVSAVSDYNTANATNNWGGYFSQASEHIFSYYADNSNVYSIELVGIDSSIAYFPDNITSGKTENSQLMRTMLESNQRIVSFGNIPIENNSLYNNESKNRIIIGVQIKSRFRSEVIGALFISLDPDEFYQKITMGIEDSMYHILIKTPENAIVSQYYCDDELEGLQKELLSINNISSNIMTIRDTKYFAHQASTDALDWKILILTNYDRIVKNLLDKLWICVLIGLGLTIILGLTSFMVLQSILIPVNELVFAMQKEEPVTEKSPLKLTGSDELTYLIQSFNEMTERIHILFVENLKAHDQNRKIELDSLQAQINPHLLYNTLESINWMAYLSGNNGICDIIQNLSTFYRLTLNQGKLYHSLMDELSQVELYIKLEQFIYDQAISYQIKMDGDFERFVTPRIILQPIVENAIMHGFNSSKLFIRLHVYEQREFLIISIFNDGAGIAALGEEETKVEDFDARTSSYGLSNINERIKLIFGRQYGITLQNGKEAGLFVKIYMPDNAHNSLTII